MNEPLWSLLLKVIFAPFIAAGLASYITYLFSRRRFIHERWWDRKADAYANIIKTLVTMTNTLDKWFEREIPRDGRDYPAETIAALQEEFYEAKILIERAATEGNSVISDEAASSLSALVKELAYALTDQPGDEFAPSRLSEKSILA